MRKVKKKVLKRSKKKNRPIFRIKSFGSVVQYFLFFSFFMWYERVTCLLSGYHSDLSCLLLVIALYFVSLYAICTMYVTVTHSDSPHPVNVYRVVHAHSVRVCFCCSIFSWIKFKHFMFCISNSIDQFFVFFLFSFAEIIQATDLTLHIHVHIHRFVFFF